LLVLLGGRAVAGEGAHRKQALTNADRYHNGVLSGGFDIAANSSAAEHARRFAAWRSDLFGCRGAGGAGVSFAAIWAQGEPDALVRTASGDVIPVERKKSRAPKRPYAGDLIQATAYCVLVEENYGRTPPFM
jgi:hypothetical protein